MSSKKQTNYFMPRDKKQESKKEDKKSLERTRRDLYNHNIHYEPSVFNTGSQQSHPQAFFPHFNFMNPIPFIPPLYHYHGYYTPYLGHHYSNLYIKLICRYSNCLSKYQ